MRRRRLWPGALVALAAMTASCESPPTRIVLVIEAEPGLQEVLASIDVTMRREGAAAVTDGGHYPLTGANSVSLTAPDRDGLLVLTPRDPADARRVYVTVTGQLQANAGSVRQVALTRFVREQTLYLHVVLTASCVEIACAENSVCASGRCEPVRESSLATTPPVTSLTDGSVRDLAPPLDGADATPIDAADATPPDGSADASLDAVVAEDSTVDSTEAAQTDAAVFDEDVGATLDVTPDREADVGLDAGSEAEVLDVEDATIDAADAPGGDTAEAALVDVDPTTISAPLLVAPLSTAIVTQRSPHFQWRRPAGADGVELQICRDRACTMEFDRVVRTGCTPVREDICELLPSADLPAGNWFWRMRGRMSGVSGSRWSEVRQVRVPVRNAARYAVGPTETDLNGDGLGDVAISSTSAPGATILWGARAGLAMTTSQNVVAAGGSVSVPGDLNQDGIVDLVVGRTISAAWPGLLIWWGGMTGLGTDASRTFMPGMPTRLIDPSRAGDVNGDGFSDLAVGDFRAGELHVFNGGLAGDLRHAATVSMSVLNPAVPPDTAGDFDGDGYADLVVSGQGGDLCRVYFGGNDGIQSSRFLDMAASAPAPMGWMLAGETNPVGDIDGDGYFDVSCGAAITASRRRTQCVYFGGPTRTVARQQCLSIFSSGSNSSGSYADGADFDQDGFGDLALAVVNTPSSISLAIYRGSATGLTAMPSTTISLMGSSDQTAYVRTQDFNGDGMPDIFLTTGSDGAYYFQNSAGTFNSVPTATFPGLNLYTLALRSEDGAAQNRVFAMVDRSENPVGGMARSGWGT